MDIGPIMLQINLYQCYTAQLEVSCLCLPLDLRHLNPIGLDFAVGNTES